MNISDKLRIVGDHRAATVLQRLHAESNRQNASLVGTFLGQVPRWLLRRPLAWDRVEPRLASMYLSLDPHNGILCYLLARALRARRIIEFGTSMGVSTIYLALAVKHNGGGVVIGTEFIPDKAARARAHLREAGVDDIVEIREGDARVTLAEEREPVDFLLNDGFAGAALPVLQTVAPLMRTGAIALCGNAGLFPADHVDYVAWVRDPANGFASMQLPMAGAGEMSVRVAPN